MDNEQTARARRDAAAIAVPGPTEWQQQLRLAVGCANSAHDMLESGDWGAVNAFANVARAYAAIAAVAQQDAEEPAADDA